MTGTHDLSVIGNADMQSRLAVFPSGGKYELVLDGAEHSAFTDRALPGDSRKRNPTRTIWLAIRPPESQIISRFEPGWWNWQTRQI